LPTAPSISISKAKRNIHSISTRSVDEAVAAARKQLDAISALVRSCGRLPGPPRRLGADRDLALSFKSNCAADQIHGEFSPPFRRIFGAYPLAFEEAASGVFRAGPQCKIVAKILFGALDEMPPIGPVTRRYKLAPMATRCSIFSQRVSAK